jgi:hypothetical protein
LGEDVIADDQVGQGARFSQLAGRLDIEEFHECRDTALFSGLSNVRRWIDTEDRDAPLDKELQQISVIAAQLGDMACRPEAQTLGYHRGVLPSVSEPGIRIGREISVFRKNVLRRNVFLKLHQKAVATDIGGEGIERLH